MPLAGRLADLWGNRRLFLAALAVFTVGSLLAGAAPTLELLIAARLVQAVGGGALVPVATSAASHLFPGAARPTGAGRDRRAHVPGHGRRAVPRRRDPRRRPPGGGARPPRRRTRVAAGRGVLGPGLALDLLRQRPDRDRRAARRVGGEQRLGDAAAAGARGHRGGDPRSRSFLVGIARRADAARQPGERWARRPIGPGRRSRWSSPAWPRSPGSRVVVRGLRVARPVPRPAAVPPRGVRLGGAGLAADRLRAGDRDRRARRCSWTASCTAVRTSSGSRSGRWRRATAVGGAPVRVRGAGALAPGGDARRAGGVRSRAC